MEAVEKYQTPLYLLDLDRFSQNYLELEEAYKKRYSNFKIAYSFKTNYTPVICKQARKLGGYAEVVSELEYHMAKRYGFTPSEIIVNGPGKISGIQEMVITINKQSYVPTQIRMLQGKQWTFIQVSDFKKANLSDSIFRFNPKAYPNAEIIDLR